MFIASKLMPNVTINFSDRVFFSVIFSVSQFKIKTAVVKIFHLQ